MQGCPLATFCLPQIAAILLNAWHVTCNRGTAHRVYSSVTCQRVGGIMAARLPGAGTR